MDVEVARDGDWVGNTGVIGGDNSDYSMKIGQNCMNNRLDSVASGAKYCKNVTVDKSKEYIDVICWNVEGWSNTRNKGDSKVRGVIKDDYRQAVVDYYNPDLLVLTETWLGLGESAFLPGYTWIGRNRTSIDDRAVRGSGGVGVFVRESLVKLGFEMAVIDDSLEDVLWVELKRKDDHLIGEGLILGICYIPPELSGRSVNVEEIYERIGDQILNYKEMGKVILCGDFNGRCGSIQESVVADFGVEIVQERKVVDLVKNYSGELLMELMQDHNMCMLNGRGNDNSNNFTCISGRGKSVVDYCITPIDNMNDLKNFEIVTMNDFCEISNSDILTRKPDHSLLRWAIVVPHSFGNRSVLVDEKSTDKIIWTYPNDNEDEYLEQLQPKLKVLESKLGNSNMGAINIDEMYEEFCGSVFECLERKQIKPISKRRLRKSKPWFNRKLWRLRKEFHGAERKWLKGKIERRKYIQSRNEYKSEVEKAKHTFEKNLCAELDELEGRNPSKWWKKVKGIIGNNKYKVDLNKVVDSEGNLVEEKENVLGVWTSHFNELLNNQGEHNSIRDTEVDDIVTSGDGKFDELDRLLEREEVEKAIRDVRLNAAPGQDMIIGKWVKNGVVTDFIFKFCEKCLELGQIPSAWRDGYIVPIPKGSSTGVPNPSKFRGISVLSVVYKIFCTVVRNRLTEMAESNGLLCEEQNGFRKGRGCLDNILMLTLLGSKYSKVGDGLRCGFIDLQKAYDSVNRDKLWDKLRKLGIKGKLLECMQSIYEDVKCSVNWVKIVGSLFVYDLAYAKDAYYLPCCSVCI